MSPCKRCLSDYGLSRARLCLFLYETALVILHKKVYIAGFSYPLEPYIEIYLCIRTRAFKFYASFIELRAIRIYIHKKRQKTQS